MMKVYNELSRREIMNWLLFDLLNGRDVLLRTHDPYLKEVVSGPFRFNMDGQMILERVVLIGSHQLIFQLNMVDPRVIIRSKSNYREAITQRVVNIQSFVPEFRPDGVVELTVLQTPLYDIDEIRELYHTIHKMNDSVIRLLRMDEHPIMHLQSSSQILSMLYELSLEESQELTQLAYLSRFDGLYFE